jgi:type I restriction enzyme S subunit
MTISKYKIKDVAEVKNGSTPSTENPAFYDGDIAWITPKDLSDQNCKYVIKGERSITKAGLDSCSTTILPKGTILLSSRAPIGLLAIAANELCTNQGFKNIIPNPAKIDSEFLYYYLKTRRADLNNLGNGTTFKEISKDSIENYDILIPRDLKEQKHIAAILSALDTKIELNNRINFELEAMAKTLYDYWFVQFDFPNNKGKPYRSSGGKIVWSKELKREIPDGWKVKKLGKVLDIGLGGTPSTENKSFWENGTFNWLNSGEVADFPIVSSEAKITEEAIHNSTTEFFPKGTTLLSITRHLRPTILAIDACANQSVVGIKEKGSVKYTYIYPYLKNEIPRYLTLRTGAQQPHINKGIVEDSYIVLPQEDSNVLNDYNKITEPIYNQIINSAFQNLQLRNLRDWLLPMLMNGQVKVN